MTVITATPMSPQPSQQRHGMQTLPGPGGATVEALLQGDGEEAVVFVHSSASGVAQWKAYQEVLSGEYTTVAVHLYGYGATTPWRGPRRQQLEDHGRLVGVVVDALARPTHIVGHSFGGAVALEAARQRRDSVRSVAVFEPSLFWVLRSAAPGSWEEISRVKRAVQAGVASGDLVGAASAFVDYWTSHGQWRRMGDRQRASVAAAMIAVTHEWDAGTSPPANPAAWLADIPVPTLVMTAPGSPKPAREVARLLTESGRRRLHVMESGGHMTAVTDAAAVLGVLRPFIERHRVGESVAADGGRDAPRAAQAS